jgi:hypothetical protein
MKYLVLMAIVVTGSSAQASMFCLNEEVWKIRTAKPGVLNYYVSGRSCPDELRIRTSPDKYKRAEKMDDGRCVYRFGEVEKLVCKSGLSLDQMAIVIADSGVYREYRGLQRVAAELGISERIEAMLLSRDIHQTEAARREALQRSPEPTAAR